MLLSRCPRGVVVVLFGVIFFLVGGGDVFFLVCDRGVQVWMGYVGLGVTIAQFF